MKAILTFALFALATSAGAQFQVNGDAFASSDSCFVITSDQPGQSGNIWTTEKINLHEPFDFRFRMYFGDKDSQGADGFVFALQPLSNTIGGTGGGLGYAGISPSFGVEFDTYQNQSPYNDPPEDHMAILRNGDVNHASSNNLAGPVPISPNSADVENDQFYWVRFRWNPQETLFEVFYDCEARLTYQGDIINTIFGGDSMVFWGVTGGTGALYNRQEVCLIDLGVEDHFLADQSRCTDDSISLKTHVSNVYRYTWSPDYRISQRNSSNPVVFPDSTVQYSVEIKDECDNARYDTMTVFVPHALDSLPDSTTCEGDTIMLKPATLADASYSWNDSVFEKDLQVLESGTFYLMVEEYGCVYRDTIRLTFDECVIRPVPNVFTPNNDLVNDLFDLRVITGDETNWNLTVYNRWGNLVYEQLGYDHRWDGGNLSDGLYFYQISVLGGEPVKGWVQIIR